MSDTAHLHHALLRPAILHILRAAGFHSTRPSTLDTITDLSARYFLLLAQRTAQFAAEREALSHEEPHHTKAKGELRAGTQDDPISAPAPTSTPIPTLPDILAALNSTAAFNNTLTPSEEAWRETLRRPLSSFPAGAARERERHRRDADDTKDIREFVSWCTGPIAKEERRISGLEVKEADLVMQTSHVVGIAAPTKSAGQMLEAGQGKEEARERDDYVTLMKKKYSRTGDGARYAGTVLGRHGRDAAEEMGRTKVKIEGPDGAPSSLSAWREIAKRQRLESGQGGDVSKIERVGSLRVGSIAGTETG